MSLLDLLSCGFFAVLGLVGFFVCLGFFFEGAGVLIFLEGRSVGFLEGCSVGSGVGLSVGDPGARPLEGFGVGLDVGEVLGLVVGLPTMT